MIKKITILLFEQNRLMRNGICTLIKKQPDMKIVSEINSSENIIELVRELKPDIVLLNLEYQNQNDLKLINLIKEQSNNSRIIILDLLPIQSEVLKYVQAGVSGFILKDADDIHFIKAIRKVSRGLKVLPPNLTGSLFSQIFELTINESNDLTEDKKLSLTSREHEITLLIANGSTNKEIAQILNVSIYTVKSHVHNILEKLSLNTRVQIAKYFYFIESSKTATNTTSLPEE